MSLVSFLNNRLLVDIIIIIVIVLTPLQSDCLRIEAVAPFFCDVSNCVMYGPPKTTSLTEAFSRHVFVVSLHTATNHASDMLTQASPFTQIRIYTNLSEIIYTTRTHYAKLCEIKSVVHCG